MNTTQLLASVDIFSDLTKEQLAKIESVCQEKTFGKDEIIFEENNPSQEFYIVVEGEVDIQLDPDLVSSKGDQHEPVTILTLRRGQSFGEVALVDQGLRSATVKSVTDDCTLLMITRKDFMKILNEDVQMGFVVMQNLAADLCLKIRNTNMMVREALLV
jgi:CRP-like cAMP-binding protein